MATALNVHAWSTTASSNATADSSITWNDSLAANAVDDSARGVMAAVRKYIDSTDGKNTAGGTADLITLTTGQSISSGHLTDGYRIGFWAAGTNTVSGVTIAVDSLSAKTIKDAQGNALVVGAITTGMFLDLVYEAGAGVFHAMNINSTVAGTSVANTFTADQTIRSSDAGAGAGPVLSLDRNSASPGDDDFLGDIIFKGRNDAAETIGYAVILSQAKDVTDGTEDGKLLLQVMKAGSVTNSLTIEGDSVEMPGTLAVTGAASLSSTLAVTGAATLSTIELGHASDTTITRASAGNIAVEGNAVYRAGGTDVAVADGGTGRSTAELGFRELANGVANDGFTIASTVDRIIVKDAGTSNFGVFTVDALMQVLLNGLSAHSSVGNGDRVPVLSSGTWGYGVLGTGAFSINGTSDYRLKENIRLLAEDMDSGAVIDALRPTAFDWIKNGQMDIGFIAHEMQSALAIAVNGEKDAVNEDGSMRLQSVDTTKLIPVLVAEIQNLRHHLGLSR